MQCGKQCSAEEEDYLTQLRNLYSNGQLCITDDGKLFREDQHIGVIHNDCLCIPKIKLKNLFPRLQPDDVVNQLYCQGAIRAGKKTKTRQIAGLHGKRFLMISLEKLQFL